MELINFLLAPKIEVFFDKLECLIVLQVCVGSNPTFHTNKNGNFIKNINKKQNIFYLYL